ncbi:MAG: polysaccharide deacetylase family protein [Anaerolineales bacterium]|jgi:peptidoglycan/xylan/chitin deacetylase (PgdA/CDA1 family)|nr:polysaccharide deacetylase family protein [Anaerolineales bacterium]
MRHWIKLVLLFHLLCLVGCSPAGAEVALPPSPSSTLASLSQPSPTLRPSLTPALPASPTVTPLPTFTPTFTQTALPSSTPEPLPIFTTRALRTGIQPQAYLAETCTYLQQRWSAEGAAPGTVVVPVMFHGIRQDGRPISDNITIYQEQFTSFILYAEELGFETITIDQLTAFLYHNAPIPERSLLMIVDDRRPGTVETSFLPVLAERGWTVTLGWIVSDTDEALWQRMEQMNATGLLDIQSHGLLHRYVTDFMTEAEMRDEIFGPITILEEHFGARPTAFIWPGGNFNEMSVRLAREAGYQVGFTAYARGPLMFNWIPLGAEEQAVSDPLMVLPRFWSTALGVNLDLAVKISEQAKTDAAERYPAEAAYYRTYCGGELTPQP